VLESAAGLRKRFVMLVGLYLALRLATRDASILTFYTHDYGGEVHG